MIVIHVTHEAVEKIGGIGAVIAGLMTSDAYAEKVSRTVLVGPLLTTDRPVNLRLGAGGRVVYSSLDSIEPPEWAGRFRRIERTYDVGIIYGRRQVAEACTGKTVEAEVILVDVFHANRDRLNLFKAQLYKRFEVPSDRFENVWEFEQYVQLAEPAVEAVRAIGCDGGDESVLYLAHEYMGMPTALRAILHAGPNTRTVFYAHEVASVRPIVEDRPGHDCMFYNVLRRAAAEERSLEEVFPEVLANSKHPLVKAARFCDEVFAVGDLIRSELRFLDDRFEAMDIDLVYNGIPAEAVTLEQKKASRDLLRRYSANLFGQWPTWTFTHVARPVRSKGIWRDLRVLHEMEGMLAQRGETAVYCMLATAAGQRRNRDVLQMERRYGWPVVHERGYPDLCGGEEVLDEMFAAFNGSHQATRAVLVNQWDFNRGACGDRMPEAMTFADLRRGTDAEFGLSVYEPFGISQLEPLSFGGICAVSSVCGCVGFARRAGEALGRPIDKNVIVGDFLDVPDDRSTEALAAMTSACRDEVEGRQGRRLAEEIFAALPRNDEVLAERIAEGYALASRMSWDHVVRDYFLPGLGRAAR